MYAQLALALAPTVLGAFQKRRKPPGFQGAQMPDRSQYYEEMMQMAMNPDQHGNRLASEAAADQVNRVLARGGLMGSSIGAQMMSANQSQLAQQFQQQQLQRMAQALGLQQQYDMGHAQVNSQNAQFAHEAAMGAHQDRTNRQNQLLQGFGAIGGQGIRMMENRDMQNRIDGRLQADRDLFAQYLPQPQPMPQAQPMPQMMPFTNPYGSSY